MSYRFNSMIAILRNSLKIHKKNCSIPGNKLCFQALSLFRSQGLIQGFYLDVLKNKKVWQGYPRYNILLKYKAFNEPVIKKIRVFKNTKSNFFFFNINRKILDPLKKKRLFLISCRKGLMLLSVENFLLLYKNKKFKGKLILEVLV